MKIFNLQNWSLTRRLSIFFALAMGIIVLILSIILFAGLVSQLKKKSEQELENILQVQQGVIQTIHSERRPSVWQQHWFENFDPQARLLLRITAPDGSLYAESKDLIIPASEFPPPTEAFSYIVWHGKAKNGRILKMYLTSKNVEMRNNQTWLIQTALNVSQEREVLESYFNILKIVILSALIITTLAGWLIARRGLKPITILNNEIQKISAVQLNNRIGNKPWPIELKNLAISFDSMLSRLEHSFTELSRFSSDIAHEFRAPINNIITAASVTQSKERTTDEYKKTLAMISEECERLSRMISTMLFLARADNSSQHIKLDIINTHILFNQLIAFYEILADERKISLTSLGDHTLRADNQLIRQAISNLLDNAIRHTSAGGSVTLESKIEKDKVLITVSDTGEGIDTEHLPHIFERFYCIDRSRSSNESTGLGLAMVKSIIEMHNGDIRVESTIGEGSRFTLILDSRN